MFYQGCESKSGLSAYILPIAPSTILILSLSSRSKNTPYTAEKKTLCRIIHQVQHKKQTSAEGHGRRFL